jgi:cell division protein FtsB
MKRAFAVSLLCLFLSCTENPEIKKLKENQAQLEARITKLEQDMKEQMKIDSVFIEMYKQSQSSLLNELKK